MTRCTALASGPSDLENCLPGSEIIVRRRLQLHGNDSAQDYGQEDDTHDVHFLFGDVATGYGGDRHAGKVVWLIATEFFECCYTDKCLVKNL